MMRNKQIKHTFKRLQLEASKFSLLMVLAIHLLLTAGGQQQFVESAPRQQPLQQHQQQQQHYYGTLIGKLNGRAGHNVSGDVYAVDEQTLFIKSFSFDGLAADAYFWSSVSSAQPAAADGFIVPDEKGSTKPLERYVDKDVVLRLPEGKTLREINWLSIWSRQTKENLGEIMIGRQLTIPRPLEIGPLIQLAHGVRSGPITIVDAQTFLVPDFHYDGLGADAYFWLTRGSQSLSASGLRLKDENGSPGPLRKYSGETVVISLPDELTVYDFDFFGVWCRKCQTTFGQTKIPQTAKVPPSPKMLGIKPENKLNCEILYDDLGYEIRWVLDGDDIVMQLVGKIEPGEYMAFGLGKDDSRSDMSNADAVVTWVDRGSGQVHAVDYFLGAKQQCDNDQRGSCPDSKLAGGGDSLTLLHGAIVNGYSMVTFKRPQLGVDELYDQHVYSDGQQSVLWAIGTLNANNEIGYHRLRTRSNMFIDFARNPQWNCPIPDLNASMHNSLPATAASQIDSTLALGPGEQPPEAGAGSAKATPAPMRGGSISDRSAQMSNRQQQQPRAEFEAASGPSQPAENSKPGPATGATTATNGTTTADAMGPWFIPSIVCPAERTLYAQIGPAGGHRGFEAITGRPSWGISWYINGIMIPELVLERGQSYLFVVEGGSDKTSVTRRHPFYLTDSPEGGFDFKTDDERLKERIYAGVALRSDGQLVPTAEGRLCEWKPTNATLKNPDLYATFAAYQRSLKLDCLPGQASVLKFAPDANTPDLIYYQCYTHRFMGWRVRIVDSCEAYLKPQNQSGNNTIKRDTTTAKIMSSNLAKAPESTQRPAYERRYALADTTKPASAEQRVSFLDFGDDSTASSSINNELATIPSDFLILNSSHLTQRQPFNLSSFEEILKLSPADIDFIDSQPEIPLEPFFQANGFAGVFPLPLPLHNVTGSNGNQHSQISKANKTTKLPKTLQSYMRRLASIYYPVQQQLASMLASQSSLPPQQHNSQHQQQYLSPILSSSTHATSSNGASTNHNHNFMQSASTEQVSSFSLSNLVPKPKIDLTKSGITKKLNKLRFTKHKDNTSQKPSQPPTPAIEFNYDIFNNQLAQLEKQQKQLQSIDHFMSWPPQQNYPPIMTASSGDQQTIDPVTQQASHLLINNLLNSQHAPATHNTINNVQYQPQKYPPSQSASSPQFRGQMPSSMGPLQHPYVVDYLSMMFNRSNNERPVQSPQAHPVPGQQQFQQPAIYITRLPLQQTYPLYIQQPLPQIQRPQEARPWPAVQVGASIRYPNIHPYANQQQPAHAMQKSVYQDQVDFTNQMTTMPSVAQTTHDTRELVGQISLDADVASIVSGNGAPFELKSQQGGNNLLKASSEANEQALHNQQQQQSGETDHMMAIERFSKQPSERRPPSIVHPVTGEQIRFGPNQQNAEAQLSSINASSSQQPRRFSNMLIDKYLLASSESPAPIQTNDLLEVDQSSQNQLLSSDLRRLNTSDALLKSATSNQHSERQLKGSAAVQNMTQQQHQVSLRQFQPPTTEMAPQVLVRPSYFHYQEPITTTTPSIGPLIPSFGPPTATTASSSAQTGDGETVLKSTLVEPITSTLIQNPSSTLIRTSPFLSHHHFDSGPFTPIELTNPLYFSANNQQLPRLRPPPFIESMLNQHQSPFRPEPPVQVASYLAQHLSSHSPMLIASEKSAASSQPMALSMALPLQASQGTSSHENNNNKSNDLVILKTTLVNKQLPQTYLLRPEYMSQFKAMGADNKPHYSNELGPSRRLAEHQFDRLSSLSSPPSTSMAVDPMQAAHTVAIVKQVNSSQAPAPMATTGQHLETNSNSSLAAGLPQAQHRQSHLPMKPMELNFEPQDPSSSPEGVRLSSGDGANTNTLYRDNNTDNAILSHVMSLISSNAIPTPPLVPVASYSSADYFLPISDRTQRSIRG